MHAASSWLFFLLLFIGRVTTCHLHPLTCMYPCPQEVLPEECIKILYQILDSTTSACKSLSKATAYNFPSLSYTLDGGNIALKQNNLFRNQDGDVSSGLRNLFSYWFTARPQRIKEYLLNVGVKAGVSNIRPTGQNWPGKDYNLATGSLLKMWRRAKILDF